MRRKVHLNFDWEFLSEFKEHFIKDQKLSQKAEVVHIPHTVKCLPLHHFDELDYQTVSSYLKRFTISSLSEEERVILHFEAVMNVAEVYLNHELLGIHEGGYTPFSFDITDLVKREEENILFVKVDSTEIKDIPPFGNVVDYLGFGGIYREVWIEVLPQIHISDLTIKTHESLSLSPSEMMVSIQVHFNQVIDSDFQLEFCVIDDGLIKHSHLYTGKLADKYQHDEEHKEVHRWDIDDPKLYLLESILSINGKEVDRLSVRFGYRDVKFSFEGFSINNRRVKLIGLNRHQSYPYVGYAMPKRIQEMDADMLKFDLGCNIVRTSHYMQSDHFISRCDEIGLLVFEEIPGWQYIGNEHFKELSLQNLTSMIQSHKNHPSIVLWGTRINESPDDHDFYTILSEKAFELDDSRQIGGVRNFPNSEFLEDVYTYNDFSHTGKNPGLQNPRKVMRPFVPYLVTEHNGHMFPTKRTDDGTIQIEQAIRHMNVMESVYKYDGISGAIGWCFADYNTHKDFGSGDRVCYHGVCDMFRIPKYAAYAYASQKDGKPVLQVLSNMNPGDNERSVIEEVVIMTNCDYILVYHNEELLGKYYSEWQHFPLIPHPPVLIDDFIGSMIEQNEPYRKNVAKRIKKVLLSYNKHGIDLPFKDKMKVVNLIAFHKFNMSEALRLYGKYLGHWGQERSAYRFEGYIDDQLAITVTKGQSRKFTLQSETLSTTLNHEETYDVTRILVRLVDEYNNIQEYADNVIHIDSSKEMEVIGPKDIALSGGSIAFFVKTIKKGKATIKITSPGLNDISFKINIL
ncbi:MAG: glycoside hydrolase family 2 protein [Firmicutes bacterium]|nr:glycoside hydrolase family 2 protein [Bacillota bacterium]